MPAAMVTAYLEHHDRDALAAGLTNLLKAHEISRHLDLDLAVKFDLDPGEDLTMVVQGREADVLSFLSRCREEEVSIKAVRDRGAGDFRLV